MHIFELFNPLYNPQIYSSSENMWKPDCHQTVAWKQEPRFLTYCNPQKRNATFNWLSCYPFEDQGWHVFWYQDWLPESHLWRHLWRARCRQKPTERWTWTLRSPTQLDGGPPSHGMTSWVPAIWNLMVQQSTHSNDDLGMVDPVASLTVIWIYIWNMDVRSSGDMVILSLSHLFVKRRNILMNIGHSSKRDTSGWDSNLRLDWCNLSHI